MSWAPLIAAEIATHGDILVLEDFIPDDKETANHIKFIALCDHLIRQEKTGGTRYDFVSKVDDDNWLNVAPFYDTFIAPRLPGGEKYKPDALAVIGRPFNYGKPFIYTSGRMYTVSWRVLELLGAKYAADPSFDYETLQLAEDMLPEVNPFRVACCLAILLAKPSENGLQDLDSADRANHIVLPVQR